LGPFNQRTSCYESGARDKKNIIFAKEKQVPALVAWHFTFTLS